jgi:hypothetical protein
MITILVIMGVEPKDSMTYAAIIAVGALDLLKGGGVFCDHLGEKFFS